jgi:hypothetical protein
MNRWRFRIFPSLFSKLTERCFIRQIVQVGRQQGSRITVEKQFLFG